MKLFKREHAHPQLMKDADIALSESSRVSERINKIVDDYQRTERVLVEYKDARRVKHA